jgi:Helix-turn-helix domain/Homeodomain-like domain
MVNGRPGVAPQTAKRNEFTRLIAEGLSIAEAARRVGIHYRTGRRWLRGRTVRLPSGATHQYAPVIIVKAPVSARFLFEEERITIGDLRRRGHTIRDIGIRLGRAPSTVSRELRRNQAPDGGYRPFRAQRMAQARPRRPGRSKIRHDPVLASFVQERLDRRWSPAQPGATRGVPRTAGTAAVDRGDLPGDLPSRKRDPSTPARDAAALRASLPPPASGAGSSSATTGGDGLHRRAPRHHRPSRGRALGGRPDRRGREPVGHWDAGGTHQPLHDPAAPGQGPHGPGGQGCGDRRLRGPAGPSAPVADLGSGQRDGVSRRHHPHARSADLLLSPRTRRGSARRTRTPMGCCGSTSPRARTCPCTRPETCARSPPS